MSTLLDALTNCSFDLQNKRDTSGDFSRKLLEYRNKVVNEYVKNKSDLNKSIAELAKKDNLNKDQIHRIVAEVNNQVYLILYDRKRSQNERDVEFDIASVNRVMQINGEEEHDTKQKAAFINDIDLKDMEKVASSCNKEMSGCLNTGILEFSVGDMSANRKFNNEAVLLKIASIRNNSITELKKTKNNVSEGLNKIASVAIRLKQDMKDVDAVFTKVAKQVEINSNTINLINNKIEILASEKINDHSLPSNFTCSIDVELEKTASEKFTLGKYTFIQKKASDVYVKPFIADEVIIRDIADIEKIAKDLQSDINALEIINKKNVYIEEKLASNKMQDIDMHYVDRLKEELLLKEKEFNI